jgi:hypothetical protein
MDTIGIADSYEDLGGDSRQNFFTRIRHGAPFFRDRKRCTSCHAITITHTGRVGSNLPASSNSFLRGGRGPSRLPNVNSITQAMHESN